MAGGIEPRVVALLGLPGSGKFAVAKRLAAAGFHRLRFADPAREMLAAGFGCSAHEIDGEARDRAQRRFGGNSVQFLMSSLIEEWGRHNVHSDVWNNEFRRRVDALAAANPDKTTYIVTEDLRRPGEAATVRHIGGIIVRVTRPDYTPQSPYAAAKMARIEADIDFTNSAPDALAAQTDAFIKSLGVIEETA